jgi:hypothetical protein
MFERHKYKAIDQHYDLNLNIPRSYSRLPTASARVFVCVFFVDIVL